MSSWTTVEVMHYSIVSPTTLNHAGIYLKRSLSPASLGVLNILSRHANPSPELPPDFIMSMTLEDCLTPRPGRPVPDIPSDVKTGRQAVETFRALHFARSLFAEQEEF